jgi:phosphoribosylanthranilate isomerase
MKVKICGLTREQDARLAIELGADALGFVLEPTSPRRITNADLDWIARLPAWTPRVAVYGPWPAGPVPGVFHLVQAVTAPSEEKREPWAGRIIQAMGLPGEGMATIQVLWGDMIVIDALADDRFGGTGRTVDWDQAARIIPGLGRPVALAGGLTPENVAEAIARTRPHGVDVSSGVESSLGIKDPDRLRAFIQAAKS